MRTKLGASTRGPLVALAVIAGIAITVTTTTHASADEVPPTLVQLDLSGISDTVLDAPHHRLYVSGFGSDKVEVVATDGSSTDTLPVSGRWLALSEDGAFLYAARDSTITRVDTATDDVTTAYGQNTCPHDVATIGDRLYFIASLPRCDVTNHQLVEVIDTSTGQVSDLGATKAGGLDYQSLVRVPGTDRLLTLSGNTVQVVDTEADTVVGAATIPIVDFDHAVFSDDGSTVILGSTTYSTTDLNPVGEADLPSDLYSVLAADADTLVAGGRAVGVLDRSTGAELNRIDAGNPDRRTFLAAYLVDGVLDEVLQSTGPARVLIDPTPRTPAPSLTFSAAQPVALHTDTLSGTLVDQGAPVSGSTITLTDPNGSALAATTTTDASGAWSLPYRWPARGTTAVAVTSSAVGAHKAAISRVTLDVAPPTIMLSAPSTVGPMEPFTITGTVTSAGEPDAQAVVDYEIACGRDGSFQSPYTYGSVTTGDDGSFSLDREGDCIDQRVTFSWGSNRLPPEFDDAHVDIHATWHIAALTIDLPDTAYVGDELDGVATYTVDGEPVSGVSLTLWSSHGSDPGVDLSGVTDAQGQVPIQVTTSARGTYHVNGQVAGTDDTTSAEAAASTTMEYVTSALTVGVDHASVRVGEPITISGTLSRDRGPVDALTVTMSATDSSTNTTRTYSTTTDAQGHFEFSDTPATAGETEFAVDYPSNDPLYEPATASQSVTVIRWTPTVTLTTDRSRYEFGQSAHVHVDLGDTPHRVVGVTATDAHNSVTELYYGDLPVGGLTLVHRMTTGLTFEVVTPWDDVQDEADTSLAVHVRFRAGVRPMGFSSISQHGIATYPATRSPRFRGIESPRRPGVCMTFEVQRRTAGRWHTVTTSRCRPTAVFGTASWRFRSAHRVGAVYRVRSAALGDDLNLAASSDWARFRFAR